MPESLPGSDSFDLDCAFQVTRAGKVEGQLHAEPRFQDVLAPNINNNLNSVTDRG
ncbi:MAG: hypothetical protein OXG98_14095 [Gemmatimonadetes bacterium]|nr:hypothetical protein [Gemmatimonadota bacterium]